MITIMLRSIPGAAAKDAKAAAREICTQMGLPVSPRSPRISRSGTAGLAAAAVCDSGSVGVDVEFINPQAVDASLLDVVLHPDERADMPAENLGRHFFSLWTRKEAVLKALGTGLAVPPTSIAVGWGDETWRRVIVSGQAECNVCSWRAPEGFAGAVAVLPEESVTRAQGAPESMSLHIVLLGQTPVPSIAGSPRPGDR